MASNYWIKLYHEILDDPKMGRLRDNLWRRAIECFLMAGEAQADGVLPPLQDMAWRLRLNEEILESELGELADVGILERREGCWFVSNFADRQSAMSNAERAKRWREQQRKQEYYAEETEGERDANEKQTNRSQNRKEEEKDTEVDAGAGAVFAAVENDLGHDLTPMLTEKVNGAIDDYGCQWVLDAIGESVANGVYRWKYAYAILERWGKEGRGKKRDKSEESEEGWAVVEEAFRRSDGMILKEHPKVLAAIDAIGGWGQVKQSSERDIPFVKQRFAKAYSNVRA